jgi:uncharacterized protein (DUF1697 family)
VAVVSPAGRTTKGERSPQRSSLKDEKPQTRHVALLRGINVGGKNKLPMADLAAIFTGAGCADVRTFIQSGNVLFTAAPKTAERLPSLVAQRIADRFGYRVPVVLRTAGELREVARQNPFLDAGAEPAALHVAFLADLPDPGDVAALDPKRSPPDSFRVRGREIYLCLPSGMARTRLTNSYFDSRLSTISTMRNWQTVLKLVDLTSPPG